MATINVLTGKVEKSRKEKIENKAQNIVNNDIYYCVSSLVSEMAEKDVSFYDHFSNLLESEPDFEECASQDDWQEIEPFYNSLSWLQKLDLARELDNEYNSLREALDNESFIQAKLCKEKGLSYYAINDNADSFEELCNDENLDYDDYRSEIYEHWIISDSLARELESYGESVEYDFYGLTIWGRSTTGQAIRLDYIINRIAEDHLNYYEDLERKCS